MPSFNAEYEKSMNIAEQELDKVYHALPEWVRRSYPEASVAERVKIGFEESQKVFRESLLREIENHKATKDFLHHIMQKQGLDYGQEYWNYLMDKNFRQPEKSEKGS